MVKVGLEVLRLAPSEWIPPRARLGLVAAGASIVTDFRPAASVLWDTLGRGPDVMLTDPATWHIRASAPPPPAHTHLPLRRHGPEDLPAVVQELDLLVFDLQDVGCSFYYLPEFLRSVMTRCGNADVKVLVLDRPNPLGGNTIAGPRIESPAGDRLPPVVHGLTVGELAQWLVGSEGIDCELEVVPMKGWRRTSTWIGSARPWVPPNPCLPTPESAFLYPATGLLRATNLSCGRGTTRPFEILGAPWSALYDLPGRLQAARINGALFRPMLFRPYAHDWKETTCVGVQIHVLDATAVRIVRAGLLILAALHQLCRDEGFRWQTGQVPSDAPGETHLPFLTGLIEQRVRPWVESGGGETVLERLCCGDREEWCEERREYLLYAEPHAAKRVPMQEWRQGGGYPQHPAPRVCGQALGEASRA